MQSLSVNPIHQRLYELIRVKFRQILHPLAHADEKYRQPQFARYGEKCAAFGRAVELRDDDAIEPYDLVECPSLRNAVIALSGVEHDDLAVRCAAFRAVADAHDLL